MSSQSRLQKEYIGIQKEKIPHVHTLPDPNDWLVWHFVIYGLADPFQDGVYYGLLEFTSAYPWSPPSMKLITPSGRFVSNQKICTTNSNYHPETWTPAWNVRTILIGLVSHLMGNDGGIGTMSSDSLTKKRMAKESMGWNVKHQKFMEIFSESFQEFTEIPAPEVQHGNGSKILGIIEKNSGVITAVTCAVLLFAYFVRTSK